jgi:hypothetical protein
LILTMSIYILHTEAIASVLNNIMIKFIWYIGIAWFGFPPLV